MKTVKDLLQKLGITEVDLSKQCRVIGNLELEIKDNPNYKDGDNYAIKVTNIRTFDALQSLTIYPYVKWTDGSFRPAYCSHEVSIYLNKRMFEEGSTHHGQI